MCKYSTSVENDTGTTCSNIAFVDLANSVWYGYRRSMATPWMNLLKQLFIMSNSTGAVQGPHPIPTSAIAAYTLPFPPPLIVNSLG